MRALHRPGPKDISGVAQGAQAAVPRMDRSPSHNAPLHLNAHPPAQPSLPDSTAAGVCLCSVLCLM